MQWVNEYISQVDFQIRRGLKGVTGKHFYWELFIKNQKKNRLLGYLWIDSCLKVSIDTSDKFYIGGKKERQKRQTFTHQSDDLTTFNPGLFSHCVLPLWRRFQNCHSCFPLFRLGLKSVVGDIFRAKDIFSILNNAFPKTMRLSKSTVLKPIKDLKVSADLKEKCQQISFHQRL